MNALRICSGFAMLPLLTATANAPHQPAPTYELYAIRYGTLANFPVRGLIAGADTTRRLDAALTLWLVRGNGRLVLVDAGFYRDKFIQRWKPVDYISPAEAVKKVGVVPEEITDIIISHVHWDHADGADLFPKARVWIQRDEYQHHITPNGASRNNAIDEVDAQMFHSLSRAGRVQQVNGDSTEIIPGITVFTGGKHTFGSQYVTIRTAGGTAVVASYNLYLYENLDGRRPIAQNTETRSR